MMKKLALFLVFVLMFTGAVPALAADDMSEIVLAVKNRVPVSEECTEFDGSPYTSDGKKRWNLTWSTSDTADEFRQTSVTINENNIITGYYISESYRRYGKALPKITEQEAIDASAAFFAKANPDVAAVYDFKNADAVYGTCDYSVQAVRREKGLEVYGDMAVFTVNGANGRIEGMNVSYTPYLVFESYDGAITEAQAEEAFEQLGGLELLYKSYYTKEGEVKTAYPVYVPSGEGARIDALTGTEAVQDDEVSVYAGNIKAALGRVEATMADMESGGAQLTQQEVDEIEKLAGLITPQQAEETLRSMSELNLAADAVLTYSGIYKNGGDNYIMDINLESEERYCGANLDAKTGEVLSFYGYEADSSEEAVYSADEGAKAAEAFVAKYYADYVNTSVKNENITYNEKDTSYRQSWTRTENGLEYAQNSMSVTVDLCTLKVTSFSLNWDKDIIFESIDGIIDAVTAYDKLFEYISPELVYYINSDKTAASPVYVTEPGDIRAINAISGKALDYNGNEYKTAEETEYTDIAGHYAEEEIRALAGIGVSLEGSEFRPDSIITQGEYIELVSEFVMDYHPLVGGKTDVERIYSNAVSNGIIDKGDVNPEAPLTRELAVTYLLRAMNYTEFAEIDGIFKCDFSDVSDISESLFGYVAIAKGLKIVSGTDGNMFLPKKQMTRAEASIIIYNYLSR